VRFLSGYVMPSSDFYTSYSSGLANRFKENASSSTVSFRERRESSIVGKSLDEPATDATIVQKFFAQASTVYSRINSDFQSLQGIRADKTLFNSLDKTVQDRINFYYFEHAQFLLDFNEFADNRKERNSYREILKERPSAKPRLRILSSAELFNESGDLLADGNSFLPTSPDSGGAYQSLRDDVDQEVDSDIVTEGSFQWVTSARGRRTILSPIPSVGSHDESDAEANEEGSSLLIENKVLEQILGAREAHKDLTWYSVLQRWYKQLEQSFIELTERLHPDILIQSLGIINLYRVMIVFCRLSWKNFWLFGQAAGWLDYMGNISTFHIDIAIMDAPTSIFNLLSVFLFMARFLIDSAMIVRHVFFPTDAERGISWQERFRIEWAKRYTRIVNDIAWMIFNALTNYAIYFHISVPVAGWLLAGFLFFDVGFLAYRLFHLEKDCDEKEQQLRALQTGEGENSDQSLQTMMTLQLDQLHYRRAALRGEFGFYIGAALLFAASYILVLSLSAPLALPVCFLGCVLAMAMYLSGESFGMVIRAQAEYQHVLGQDGSSVERQAEKALAVREAWLHFAFTLTENIVIPVLIIGLFTINWPAAIALTVLYIAYKQIDFKKKADDEQVVGVRSLAHVATENQGTETGSDSDSLNGSQIVPVDLNTSYVAL